MAEAEPHARRCDEAVLRLAYRPPYDWAHTQGFLARRALRRVERVDEAGYRRTLACPGGQALIVVRPIPGENALELRVTSAPPAALPSLAAAARRVFDIAANPAPIAVKLSGDARLKSLVAECPGMRIPGAWDAFECAVRAVLGQQVSVAAGCTLATRLVERAGEPLREVKEGLTHLFPTPERLAQADLAGLGLTGARAGALKSLALAVLEQRVDFAAAPAEVIRTLAELPGIGPWTAQYVALRALGEPDAFPYGDWVLRRMAAAPGRAVLSARELEELSQRWRPWRAYATLHLWRAAGKHGADASRQAPRRAAAAAPRA